MANRKKDVNPIITSRLQELIEGSDKSIRWICENILNYASSNFNRFLKGEAQPPDYILDALAEYFCVRKEWLYGLDDYRTYNDLVLSVKNILDNFSYKNINSTQHSAEFPMIFDKKINAWRRMSVKEEAKYNLIINSLTLCGYNWTEINDSDNFFEFMDSPVESLKNSIELYMKTINPTQKRKDEKQ